MTRKPPCCSALLFLLLLLLSSATRNILGREVMVDDPGGPGVHVHLMQKIPNINGRPSRGDPKLRIHSGGLPVTILRYNDRKYWYGGEPIADNDVYVVVKSNCSDPAAFSPTITTTESQGRNCGRCNEDHNAYTDSIYIMPNPNTGTEWIEDYYYSAPVSSFLAYFDYTSHGCLAEEAERQQQQKQQSTFQKAPELPKDTNPKDTNPKDIHPKDTPKDIHPEDNNQQETPVHLRTQETCWAAVEVIVNGCRRSNQIENIDLVVSAPRVQIRDAKVDELAKCVDPDNRCTQLYDATIEFPIEGPRAQLVAVGPRTNNNRNHNEYWIPSIEYTKENYDAGLYCSRAIEGRPFVDSTGRQLSASIQHNQNSKDHEPSWSKPASAHTNKNNDEKVSLKQQIVKTALPNNGSNPDHPRHLLGVAWEQRALGEHASIPAFSAFSIALLSNNAPHTLVNDALQAAMDEVRHAKTSFDVASLLLGRTVEPGPLPPSHHDFGPDLVQLAVAAAKEGCIDETLSAFAAAQEATALLQDQQHQHDDKDGVDDATKFMLREKLVQIALEETRHSALAWRTVQWACQNSSDACAAVQREAFGAGSFSSYLDQAFEKRFGGMSNTTNQNEHNTKLLKDAWTSVYRTLVPFVTSSEDMDQQSQMICGKMLSTKIGLEEPVALGCGALLEHMSRSIIEGTICSPL